MKDDLKGQIRALVLLLKGLRDLFLLLSHLITTFTNVLMDNFCPYFDS